MPIPRSWLIGVVPLFGGVVMVGWEHFLWLIEMISSFLLVVLAQLGCLTLRVY